MKRRVPQTEVVRSWLRREQRKQTVDIDLDAMTEDWQLVGTLCCLCPFQASFLWRYPVAWYRTDVDEQEFRRLRVIEGPADESWRVLSPDDTILGAARRILDDEIRGRFEDIDVDHVRRLAERPLSADPGEHLVLFRNRRRPTSVADGNHYATAKAIRLLRTGEYPGQEAYLGVRRSVQLGDAP